MKFIKFSVEMPKPADGAQVHANRQHLLEIQKRMQDACEYIRDMRVSLPITIKVWEEDVNLTPQADKQ